jgi:hypothetical protein
MAEKVTFDTARHVIKFKPGVISVDFQKDIYSAGKQDWIDEPDLHKFIFPIVSIGGNIVTGGKRIEPTFFLRNGWQMEPDSANHTCTIYGNIFHLENLPLVIFPAGNYAIALNLSTTISPDTGNTVVVQRASEDMVYGGAVTIKADSVYTGTEYPIGTRSYPLNNIVDAMTIVAARGFNKLQFIGDFTLDASADVRNMILVGQDPTHTTITIEDAANVQNCIFEDAYVCGVLDGGNIIRCCKVDTISYVNGCIQECVLADGVITLGGGLEASILNCHAGVAGPNLPTIDMGGSGQTLDLRNYNGAIKIINKTGVELISIDMNSGYLIIDSTVTAGDIYVRGICKIVDNSQGANVIHQAVVNVDEIADAVWDDPVAEHTGTGSVGKLLQDTERKVDDNQALIISR